VSSLGPFVDRLECEFAAFIGTRYAVACGSGAAALHLALRSLGIGPGDEVLMRTLAFVASANPICYQGGTPVFVDSEEESLNLDPAIVIDELDRRTRLGLWQPAAIEVVHLVGHRADLQPIMDSAERHGVAVVQDASEALGATYASRPPARRSRGTTQARRAAGGPGGCGGSFARPDAAAGTAASYGGSGLVPVGAVRWCLVPTA